MQKQTPRPEKQDEERNKNASARDFLYEEKGKPKFTVPRGCPLLEGVPEEGRTAVLACLGARAIEREKGELFLRRGETTASMCLVLRGTVHVVQEDFWGNAALVGQAGPGDLFGEAYACLPGLPLEVNAVAAQRTEVLLLDALHVLHPCAKSCPAHTRLAENLVRVLAQKNLMLTRKVGHMAKKTTREKLLSYLSAQGQAAGSDVFTVPFDRQQLADYLSVERSAMCHALAGLRREGVVEFQKNKSRLLHAPEDMQ